MKTVYEYDDYRKLLSDYIVQEGKGAKLRLAHAIECQPGYISQIMSGQTNLSAEQALKFVSYLGWDHAMTQYFLLLVAYARAGTETLASHYLKEIDSARAEAQVLKNRFKPAKVLSIEDQAVFYSSWHYGAIYVSVSIPDCETVEGIAAYFDLPVKKVNEAVNFLERVGLIKRSKGGVLSIGISQVYLGADSPLISKHHTNWRMQAIAALDRYRESHLHYSSVVSISASDTKRVREIMAQAIQQIRSIVRDSRDEKCFSYSLDLFEVGRN